MAPTSPRNPPAPAPNGPPPTRWEDLLLIYLRDPFDKVLEITGHERRAARYAAAALGRPVAGNEMKVPDVVAATAERLPLPTAGPGVEGAVQARNGIRLIHPLSGAATLLECSAVNERKGVEVVTSVVSGLPTARERFLALWRLLPDRAAEALGADAARLPADPRIPDHTHFQRADAAAGLYTAFSGAHGAAFLSFFAGPVQPFIAAARSVRDLWSGSAILSWLCFQAMKPILERFGPTAFVYPALRGAPLVDRWLRLEAGLGRMVEEPPTRARRAPSLPNRFVALAPWGPEGVHADALRRQCLEAADAAWRRLAEAVRTRLDAELKELDPDWARRWESQIGGMFDFRCTAAPERHLSDERLAQLLAGEADFEAAWPDAAAQRRLADAIPPQYRPDRSERQAGRWQAQMEYCARLMAAERALRTGAASTGVGGLPSPPKCTLFGSWEQVGPPGFAAARAFWQRAETIVMDGVRLRPGERLCAVALTKRFAGPALLADELGLQSSDLRFPDTATVAAAVWLHRAGIDPDAERRRTGNWSGQWLHWRSRTRDDEPKIPPRLRERLKAANQTQGQPPAYYAVLAMDGDRIGRWLAGRSTPRLRNLLHPKLRSYLEGLGDDRAAGALEARRPVSPALQNAISSALATFAIEVAPELVARRHGTTIYSGGDDLLALCPLETALACAAALRRAFAGTDAPVAAGWRMCGLHPRITMGERATMSAGLAIVHHKEDLRSALDAARQAEHAAKDDGRDRIRLVTIRRSGEQSTGSCPWPLLGGIDELRAEFADGASSRWTYRLRAELPALSGPHLPGEALTAEIRRLVDRSDEGAGDPDRGGRIAGLFDRFLQHSTQAGGDNANPLRDFVALCQTAAFMARGRDD